MGLEIVLLGPPGSGKGTQSKRVAGAHGIVHISTGDILRANIEQRTELGKQARPYVDQGELVPDALVCALVRSRTKEADCSAGYVLDGFPRSLTQARVLRDTMAEAGDRIDVAIDLAVPEEELVERLTARRSCPKCGAIYNLKFNPPRRYPYCDVEGDENVPLEQRPDDEEATVLRRLRVYHETTEPLLAFYEAEGLLKSISGSRLSPDDVFRKVEEILVAVGAGRRP